MIYLRSDLTDVKDITDRRTEALLLGLSLDSFPERQLVFSTDNWRWSHGERVSLRMDSWIPCKCRKARTSRVGNERIRITNIQVNGKKGTLCNLKGLEGLNIDNETYN